MQILKLRGYSIAPSIKMFVLFYFIFWEQPNQTTSPVQLSHRFVLQIELSNQLPVISRINNLPTNKELYLGMSSISFDSV